MGVGRDIFYAAGLAVTSPVWGVSMLRTGKWRTDWRGRLGRAGGAGDGEGRGGLLIHAVSVGEVNLVRQLVDMLAAQGVDVIISTTTNTGFERATALYGGRHRVVRWPLDFTAAVATFLDAVRPDAVALVELEVWPNFVEACVRRGIPVAVINGRLSERSFKRYRLIAPLLRGTFAQLAAAAVQTPDYADRFRAMGVPADRIHVLDTMKWDTARVQEPADVDGVDTFAAEMGIDRSRPIVVAGSTAPGEDELLLRARSAWPAGAQLVIAPRKPEWFRRVVDLEPQLVRRTEAGRVKPLRRADVFLLDTIGELRKAYALADVAVVGRSFVPMYGSDMMEPIALGVPTVIGPHFSDFADVMQALTGGGGIVVADDPAQAVARLLADPQQAGQLARRGRDVILSRQGATRRHLTLLGDLLQQEKELESLKGVKGVKGSERIGLL